MNTRTHKVHFEFRPGEVWCRVGRRAVALTQDEAKVTCQGCRELLEEKGEPRPASLRAAVEALR